MRAYQKTWREKHLEYSLFRYAKYRAQKFGIKFSLEIEDIVIPDTCPVFGFKLEAADRHMRYNSPTLDKIIPEKGYTKGNVWVISNKANTMKNNASLEELKMLTSKLEERIAWQI